MRGVAVLDSVTAGTDSLVGVVVVAASHGGRIAAVHALRGRWAALIVHDASVGLDAAGTESLRLLEPLLVPAATVGGPDAPIGDGAGCLATGRLTAVNAVAAAIGLRPGWLAGDAVQALSRARLPTPRPGGIDVAAPARVALPGGHPIWLLGSASEVTACHEGAIVVTGSHAELLGGRPETALKARARLAVFNDAGSPRCTRLPVLDELGVAGVAVAAASARIGDAASSLATGVISVTNRAAHALGARPGRPVLPFVVDCARGA